MISSTTVSSTSFVPETPVFSSSVSSFVPETPVPFCVDISSEYLSVFCLTFSLAMMASHREAEVTQAPET